MTIYGGVETAQYVVHPRDARFKHYTCGDVLLAWLRTFYFLFIFTF
jgi:hypothetical protein